MFKIIDRYLLKEVAPPFVLGLLIYSFVLLMNQLLQFPDLFIARGVTLADTLKLLAYLIPAILAFTVPMAVLMGILAGLSRMSSDSEVTALRTLGISPRRVLRPLFTFALGGWLAASALTMVLTPHFNFKWTQTFTEVVLNRAELQFNPREFNESITNVVLYIQNIAKDRTWQNVFIAFNAEPEKPRILLAKRARLHVYPDAKKAVLELWDAVQHVVTLTEPDTSYQVQSSAHVEEEIDVRSLFPSATAEKRVREKNIAELFEGAAEVRTRRAALAAEKAALDGRRAPGDSLDRAKNDFALLQAEHDRRSYGVEIHKRFALPFVCWIFVFLGLPLGSSTRKGGRTSGFTLSLIIILVYYVGITAGEQLAMNGLLPPFLGIWGPNLVLGAASVVLFIASAKESPLLSLFRRRPPVAASSDARPAAGRRRRFRLSLRFPNILDRYVIRKYLFIAGLALSSFVTIAVIVTFFDKIGTFNEHGKPFSMLLLYIACRVPEFVHFGLPVTALMSALLTIGLLTKTNEITAMKANGISIYRALLPIVALSVLVGGLSLGLQEKVYPRANKLAEETWNRIIDLSPQSYSFENRRWVANKAADRFYHYSYFDPKTSRFNMLAIYDLDLASWSLSRRGYAERATLDAAGFHFEDGWIRELGPNGQYIYRKTLDVPLDEEKSLFLREWKTPAQMNAAELGRYIRDVESLGYETLRDRVSLAAKAAFPCTALIMTLLGLPFAFSMGKRGTLVGIGIGIAIAMVYWVSIGIFIGLGNVGFLSVFLAAWGPNLIFGLGGMYLLLTIRT
jgi:LPS export ABC transporter permease LptF/LPS export ABC transporter permease LptG